MQEIINILISIALFFINLTYCRIRCKKIKKQRTHNLKKFLPLEQTLSLFDKLSDYNKKFLPLEQTLSLFDKLSDYNKFVLRRNSIKMIHGDMYGEIPEQVLSSLYIKPHHKVLEIGGNIGRNSMMINSILNDTSNLVILESDKNSGKLCLENLKNNNFKSQMELSALSKRKLIQKGWNTKPSNVLLDGWKLINTIDMNKFRNKYKIKFNVLVIDCEGAFYFILQDMPEILDGIELIIMENDYGDILHYNFVKQKLEENNFINIYTINGRPYGAAGAVCCDYFFQVWEKK